MGYPQAAGVRRGRAVTPLPAVAILVGAKRTRSEAVATPEQERAYLAQFENFSNEQIRHELVHGFVPGEFTHALTVYLSKREMDSSSAQIDTARRAADAAEHASEAASRTASAAARTASAAEKQAAEARRANKKANIALAIAIISPIITAAIAIVSIVIAHWGVHK